MNKRIKGLTVLVLTVMVAVFMTRSTAALCAIKSKTDTWRSFGISFVSVTLKAQGNTNTGDVYDVWFSNISSYYPFYISSRSTRQYKVGKTGYAKGEYTWRGGIASQWIDLPIRSETRTITIVFQ